MKREIGVMGIQVGITDDKHDNLMRAPVSYTHLYAASKELSVEIYLYHAVHGYKHKTGY